MLNIFSRLIIALSMLLPLTALGSSTVIGYCDGRVAETSHLGNNTGGKVIEAASVFPASMFEGYENPKLLGLKVGLASRLNISEITVWVRESLESPNIFEKTLTKEEGIKKGWNVIIGEATDLPKGNDLYAGYTIKLAGASFPISAVGESRPGGLWLNTGNGWEDMSEAGLGVLSIEMLATADNLIPYDLALRQVRIPESIKIGSTVPLSLRIFNAGADNVTGFSVECSVDGYAPVTFDIDRDIQANEYCEVDLDFTSPVVDKSPSVSMTVRISAVKDGEDADLSNNELIVTFASNRFDFNKKLLLEEFSTEKCTFCPRAAVVLHDLIDEPEFENKIIAAVHHVGFNTDWLTVPESKSYLWFYDGGVGHTYAPAFMYDRYSFDNNSPVSGATDDYSAIKQKVAERLAQAPMCALEAEAVYDNAASALNIHVEGERLREFKGNRITVYVVENEIPARNQAGATGPFTHQHALRNLNELWGDIIQWNDDNDFSYDTSIYIHPEWKKENLEVIAFISEYNPVNYKDCTIDNAVKASVDWNLSTIEEVGDDMEECDPEYFTLTGFKVSKPSQGIYVVRRGNRVSKEYVR